MSSPEALRGSLDVMLSTILVILLIFAVAFAILNWLVVLPPRPKMIANFVLLVVMILVIVSFFLPVWNVSLRHG